MNKGKELAKNTIIIFIGKFCTQFISFLLLPIYTYSINTSDYGYIDLLQTYISLLVPIIILRFDSGIFRFLIDERKNEEGKEKIISNTIIFLILQSILVAIVYLVLNIFLNIRYSFAIIINIIFIAISSILLQLSRGVGDNIGYSISSIITGISTVLLNVLFLIVLKMDASSILLASGIANIICSIFLFFRNKIYKFVSIKKIDKNKFIDMLKYSLPMIPDGLSWWVVNVSDRTIISFMINSAANGIYAISSKFSNILSSVFQVFNMSWQESASLHINEPDRNEFFSNILNTTYKLFYSICICILVAIPVFFNFAIGNNYINAKIYIPILLLGNLYNAIANVIGGTYIAMKNTKEVARTTILSAVINIIINLVLIKKLGLFAAAISTLISYIILTIYRYIDVQKYLKMKFNYITLIITTIIFVICGFLYYKNTLISNVLNIIIAFVISVVLNIEFLNKIVNKIRRRK